MLKTDKLIKYFIKFIPVIHINTGNCLSMLNKNCSLPVLKYNICKRITLFDFCINFLINAVLLILAFPIAIIKPQSILQCAVRFYLCTFSPHNSKFRYQKKVFLIRIMIEEVFEWVPYA